MMKDDRWKENKFVEYFMKLIFFNEVNLKKIILISWFSLFYFEIEWRRIIFRKIFNRLGNNFYIGVGVFSKIVLYRYWELKVVI